MTAERVIVVKKSLSEEEYDALADAVIGAHEVMQKIFSYLNSYAKKEDLAAWSATSPHAVLAQVYGDLAAEFSAIKRAAEFLKEVESR